MKLARNPNIKIIQSGSLRKISLVVYENEDVCIPAFELALWQDKWAVHHRSFAETLKKDVYAEAKAKAIEEVNLRNMLHAVTKRLTG